MNEGHPDIEKRLIYVFSLLEDIRKMHESTDTLTISSISPEQKAIEAKIQIEMNYINTYVNEHHINEFYEELMSKMQKKLDISERKAEIEREIAKNKVNIAALEEELKNLF